MRRQPRLFMPILLVLVLSGCGQKGGLYIPQEPPPPEPSEQDAGK